MWPRKCNGVGRVGGVSPELGPGIEEKEICGLGKGDGVRPPTRTQKGVSSKEMGKGRTKDRDTKTTKPENRSKKKLAVRWGDGGGDEENRRQGGGQKNLKTPSQQSGKVPYTEKKGVLCNPGGGGGTGDGVEKRGGGKWGSTEKERRVNHQGAQGQREC